MRSLVSVAIRFAALMMSPVPALAQGEDDAELIVERIHSDLPLYTFDWDDIWPQSFRSDDEFGCTSVVGLGDWRFTPADAEDGEESWERYSNYGVFHCAAIIRTAGEQGGLAEAKWHYGFFVRLGKSGLGSKKWELWALQKGMIPGSEYVLMARQAGPPGRVDSFRVLQQRCPPGRLREARGFDIWSTRYCSIDSRAELLALARRMLRRPPVGILRRVAAVEESGDAD